MSVVKDLGNLKVCWIFGTSLALSNMASASEGSGLRPSGVAAA